MTEVFGSHRVVRSCHSSRLAERRHEARTWVDRHAALTRQCVVDFVGKRCAEHLGHTATAKRLAEVVIDFAGKGKYLRSTFAYLGWLCGQPDDPRAVQASASLELLHTFALMQDDVMDESPTRRGAAAVHVQAAEIHHAAGLPGSAARFGESAATVLADLCLIWSEQMLRESGLPPDQLADGFRRYDIMRTELAAGQLDDLHCDARRAPTFAAVVDIARRKSGNYTVRRPLEIGADLAFCDPGTIGSLATYGTAVGEAFQMRDDLHGAFGNPARTGKPAGDLYARKASTIVALAHDRADATQRSQLQRLAGREPMDAATVARWQELIIATGAVDELENAITTRVDSAIDALDGTIPELPYVVLTELAHNCTGYSLGQPSRRRES